MTDCYLAFDLGAESGRAVLGTLGDDGRMALEEVARFPNRAVPLGPRLHWDLVGLYAHMLDAMAECRARGYRLQSVGIDTWGVDFGLLDAGGDLIALPRAYRDPSRRDALAAYAERFSLQRLHERTGNQVLPINSVFGLYALARESGDVLAAARQLLFVPDLLAFWLTGERMTEATIASTSQLLDPRSGGWCPEVFEEIGVPIDLMGRLVPAGTRLGAVTGAAATATGQGGLGVVAVATHDTASAVAALPLTGPDFAYVSSGTWSLVGIETAAPIIGPETFAANVTNELGVAGTVRVLKNVTGLWLLQACRRAWARRPGAGGRAPTYDALVEAAEAATPLRSLVDPDHGFAPDADMPAQIASFCRRTGQPEPRTQGEVARCVLESLALAYRYVLAQLGEIGSLEVRRVHVVGGGSRNRLLCQLTADATGLEVIAGPAEATALGNLLVQAMAAGAIPALADLRTVARDSVVTTAFEPSGADDWDEAYERFLGYVALGKEARGW